MIEKYNQVFDKINSYSNIIIHRHLVPDPDAVGSQKALGNFIKLNFKDKNVYLVGDKETRLVKQGYMKDVILNSYKDSLVIVLDTANKLRIEGSFWDKGDFIIKIDHHPPLDNYGHLNIIDEKASSTSEILTEMFDYFVSKDNNIKLSKDICNQLYSGIVGDTQRYFYACTTEKTLRLSSILVDNGADNYLVNRRIEEKTLEHNNLINDVYSKIETNKDTAKMIVSRDTLNKYNLMTDDAYVCYFIPNKIREIEKWVVFVGEEELGNYRCSIRSKGVSINTLANKFGGGGHPHASGCNNLSFKDIDAIYHDLINY